MLFDTGGNKDIYTPFLRLARVSIIPSIICFRTLQKQQHWYKFELNMCIFTGILWMYSIYKNNDCMV